VDPVFPKDLQALMAMGAENNYANPLLEPLNDMKTKKGHLSKNRRVFCRFWGLRGKTIGIGASL